MALDTVVPLRCETGVRLYGGVVTTQTIETQFGTTLSALPFSATTTYHFYSPPMAAAVSLLSSDKGGGVIYIRNTAPGLANDFSVSGRMEYFDYDPATGADTLIVDTSASPAKNVNHGQTVNWAIPNQLLQAPWTIAPGHMLHVAVTIGLLSGNPGSFGELLYNGPSGSSTVSLLPQNRSQAMTWTFAPPPPVLQLPVTLRDGTISLTCAGTAGSSYSLEATTSLRAPIWVTLVSTNADSNGLFTFVDQDATNYPMRFYRAKP